jgi:hypothetical protein
MATCASTLWDTVRAFLSQPTRATLRARRHNAAGCTAWEVPRVREHVEWSFCAGSITTHFARRAEHGRCRFCGVTTTLRPAHRAA